jgi:predicted RNA-binding Zn ribbon-like protein
MKTVTSRFGEESALGLANSLHGPGAHYRRRARPGEPAHDHLRSAEDAVEFLATHAIPVPAEAPTDAQLRRLRTIRSLVRALADARDDLGGWTAELDAALARVDFRLRADGTIHSTAGGWDGIADDLLPAALALAADRDRIRTCGNPRCRWLFVDRSRLGNRVWCEMAVCGNRMKVGRHRMRPVGGSIREVVARSDTPRAVSRPGTPS